MQKDIKMHIQFKQYTHITASNTRHNEKENEQ